MFDKHVWKVLFLAFSAATSLVTASLTPSGPSCHDGVPYQRTHRHNLTTDSGPVIFANDTTYEQLTCIGFNPVLNLLSATIEVKLPSGFSGGLCSNGSFEYVRFWVNYGSGWSDIGLTAVNTHDIADSVDCRNQSTKPLLYTVSINFQPEHQQCAIPVLPKVRATLSWDAVPSTDPYDSPTWGNTLEDNIQSLATEFLLPPAVVFTGMESNSSIDHMGSADRYVDGGARDQQVVLASHTQDADPHPGSIPNTFFEELTCLGLDADQSSLVATVRVKQRLGYFATPCQDRSAEYVSFWADWNNSCSWTYLGTTKFFVHDFASSPSTGLVYTAVMPVDVLRFSAPCNDTKIARVRAALAFNEIPPPPPAIAPRGNFIETHVHLQPYNGSTTPTIPRIRLIGNVPVQQIETTPGSPTSGMTLPNALIVGYGFADPSPDLSNQHLRPCPFGGLIIIRGEPVLGHAYRLMARPYPPPSPAYPGLAVIESIFVTDLTLGGQTIRIDPEGEGYFNYLPLLENFENILSYWKPIQGSWQIRLEMVSIGTHVHEDYTPWYMVVVNNMEPRSTGPIAFLDIFGTECNDLKIGNPIEGRFYATSAYFDHWEFSQAPVGNPNSVNTGSLDHLLPVPPPPPPPPPPPANWELATINARPCGYVISLGVWDRTVVDSGRSRYYAPDTKGYCLRA